MNKQITLEQAVEKVQDGMTIMFGGFLGNGSATQIIDAIVEKGVKDLTIIANDTAYDEVAHGKLVSNHQVKKAIVSHTGTNKQTALQKNEGTLIVEYVPQGTLAERIRAAGAGRTSCWRSPCVPTSPSCVPTSSMSLATWYSWAPPTISTR